MSPKPSRCGGFLHARRLPALNGIDPDALLTASQGAVYCDVTLAAFCNWTSRGYRNEAGEHVYLRPATRPDGTPRRNEHRHLLYRLIDIAAAEAATSEAAGRLNFLAAA